MQNLHLASLSWSWFLGALGERVFVRSIIQIINKLPRRSYTLRRIGRGASEVDNLSSKVFVRRRVVKIDVAPPYSYEVVAIDSPTRRQTPFYLVWVLRRGWPQFCPHI